MLHVSRGQLCISVVIPIKYESTSVSASNLFACGESYRYVVGRTPYIVAVVR